MTWLPYAAGVLIVVLILSGLRGAIMWYHDDLTREDD